MQETILSPENAHWIAEQLNEFLEGHNVEFLRFDDEPNLGALDRNRACKTSRYGALELTVQNRGTLHRWGAKHCWQSLEDKGGFAFIGDTISISGAKIICRHTSVQSNAVSTIELMDIPKSPEESATECGPPRAV